MRVRSAASLATILILSVMTTAWLPPGALAAPITYSGTITYQGSYAGDTLYVAAVDTVGTEDVTILGLKAIPVGLPPFSQPYSLDFDNTGVSSILLVAAFLDVDGGGVDSVGGGDVFGWYAGGTAPAGVSSASSRSGLDFALPEAEIHGTITFAPDQIEARVNISENVTCTMEGFRPGHFAYSSGPYSILGVYPGTYCVSGRGYNMSGPLQVCYGDPTCASPTSVTLTATQVRTGIDLDFSAIAPVEKLTWGRIKALYP